MTKLLSFSLCNNPTVTISINKEIIEETRVAKYLRILIDNKRQWKDQINSINLKLSKSIGLLSKLRHFVPKFVLRSIYFSFIYTHVDYNILNWGTSSTTDLNSVNTIIKKALRMCFKKRDELSLPLFKEVNILPLDKTFKLKQAKVYVEIYKQLSTL